MDVDDTQYNPWSTQSPAADMETDASAGAVSPHETASTVPALRTAAEMETDTPAGALILHGRQSFQKNPMHPTKRQSSVNKRALPVYTMDNETMRWLRTQHYEDSERMALLRQDVQHKDGQLQVVWSALNQQVNTLEGITKEKERVEKMLEEQRELMNVMQDKMRENNEATRQRLLQLEGAMKQKDNELITLNTRIKAAASSSASNASTSGVLSSSAPGASTSRTPPSFASGSTPGVPSSSAPGASTSRASSSFASGSAFRVPLSSTQGASTTQAPLSFASGSTSNTSSSSQRPGTGRTPIKVVHNSVTLPISSLRTKRQSETSKQVPEQREDIKMDGTNLPNIDDATMDGADLPNIDDATLNDASAKELLKMCTLFLKAAVTGKAELRKENPVKCSPSKKTAARMEQHKQMHKHEINALQRFIRQQFLTLTGMGMLEEFISYEPVEESLVIAFREGTRNGPEDGEYTLDLSPGFRGSRWNRITIKNMVGVVQAELLKEEHLVDVDNAYVEETLRNLLSSAQQKWVAAIPRFKKGRPELETEAKVVECLTETSRPVNAKAVSHAAKDRKHKTRTTIVKRVIYLKTKQRANDLPVWKFMQQLVEYLGPGRHVFGGEWDKRLPRERENVPRFDKEVHAPAELPRSLYDSDWLTSLEEDDREEMAVSEEVFELLERAVPDENRGTPAQAYNAYGALRSTLFGVQRPAEQPSMMGSTTPIMACSNLSGD
ncbi:hypothetical protein IW261DRAFT_1427215 [Armillaria novae-zelandiae]|uniref:Uncharacterized protein n=1 Tax=Armillaria novae-zelandiae TaxID=153914 RepID=A0AA39NHF2_9AGAR|nr:hypothetical protein IW261DRAFT_1427215 [Armillaria novae-zelandiae]